MLPCDYLLELFVPLLYPVSKHYPEPPRVFCIDSSLGINRGHFVNGAFGNCILPAMHKMLHYSFAHVCDEY